MSVITEIGRCIDELCSEFFPEQPHKVVLSRDVVEKIRKEEIDRLEHLSSYRMENWMFATLHSLKHDRTPITHLNTALYRLVNVEVDESPDAPAFRVVRIQRTRELPTELITL